MASLRRAATLRTAKPAKIVAPEPPEVPLFERLARLLDTKRGRELLTAELDQVDPPRLLLMFRQMMNLLIAASARASRRLVASVRELHELEAAHGLAAVQTPDSAPVPQATMLDIQGVAHRLGVSASTARRMIAEGKLPEGVEVGDRAIRYDSAELEAAIKRLPRR